jgi:hypothetical protein
MLKLIYFKLFPALFSCTCSLPHPQPGCLQGIKQEPTAVDAEHRLLLASEMKNVNMRHGFKGAGGVLQILLLSRTGTVLL